MLHTQYLNVNAYILTVLNTEVVHIHIHPYVHTCMCVSMHGYIMTAYNGITSINIYRNLKLFAPLRSRKGNIKVRLSSNSKLNIYIYIYINVLDIISVL